MTQVEYLNSLEFMSFERYPEQNKPVYLKCEGTDKVTKEHVCHYVRVNSFDATTFSPETISVILKNHNVDWSITWYPVEKMDKKYD